MSPTRRRARPWALLLLAPGLWFPSARMAPAGEAPSSANVVVRLPTLGGQVWWIDVWAQDGYRIQTHKIAGLHRLLDPGNALVRLGGFDRCLDALALELATPPALAPVNWNIDAPTMGGAQFWGDEFYARGWKIQRNILTTHYRLLDDQQRRRAWGSWDQCRREFDRLAPPAASAGARRPLVILLHGILRSASSFEPMTRRLEAAGYEVCGINYPSSQASIEAHADQLNRLLGRLKHDGDIYFIAHSMGGLVARRGFQMRPEPRARALVTLGTPHHGAIEANMLQDWYPFKVVFGPSGQQLIAGSASFVASLPPPPLPVACIAGGKGDGKGFSPILAGDDDGTVEIDSAILENAADALVVDCLHSFLMRDEVAIDSTVRFLATGRFRAAAPEDPTSAAGRP